MNYILIFKELPAFYPAVITKKYFEKIIQLEEFINERQISREAIIYMGENKPLQFKVNIV